jgi:hypothetical protein
VRPKAWFWIRLVAAIASLNPS